MFAGDEYMLEVVFDDSSKGSMKMAKSYNTESMANGAVSIAYIGEKPSKKEQKKELKKFITKMEKDRVEGKAVGGSAQDIVCIGFALDIGDITCEIDSEQQKNKYTRMFEHVPFEINEIERYFATQREDYERLIDTAKRGGHIRIWKSNAPFTACGFAFLCDILRNINCKISVIDLPEYFKSSDDTIRSYANWGEIQAGQLYMFLPLEREISENEKYMQSSIWNNLKDENAPIRALVNGKLVSVPEDFYDHIIVKNIPDGEFVLGQLIGNILGKYPLGVADWWYSMRIKKMITENELVIVNDKDKTHPYGKILRKAEKI